jgi:hypothetical protein
MEKFSGTNDKTPYQLDPLPSDQHIRLMYIVSAIGGRLHCNMTTLSLADTEFILEKRNPDIYRSVAHRHKAPSKSPSPAPIQHYHALSYCCGDGPQDCAIWVDDHVLPVTSNLLGALQALHAYNCKTDTHTIPIWVDAICIDQLDEDEKSTQVQMMNKIFYHAEQVFIWLGPEEESSTRVFGLLQVVESLFDYGMGLEHFDEEYMMQWYHYFRAIDGIDANDIERDAALALYFEAWTTDNIAKLRAFLAGMFQGVGSVTFCTLSTSPACLGLVMLPRW